MGHLLCGFQDIGKGIPEEEEVRGCPRLEGENQWLGCSHRSSYHVSDREHRLKPAQGDPHIVARRRCGSLASRKCLQHLVFDREGEEFPCACPGDALAVPGEYPPV